MKRTRFSFSNPDDVHKVVQQIEHIKSLLDELLLTITNTDNPDTRTRAQLVLLRNTHSFDAHNCTPLENKTKSFQLLGPSITPKMFETFWNLYPRKVDKALAKDRWNKICAKKDRPKWKVIEQALIDQKKSERWIKQPDRIPYPTTWLNKCRWEDDPKEMKAYPDFVENNKPKEKFFGHIRYKLAPDGYYYGPNGDRWID